MVDIKGSRAMTLKTTFDAHVEKKSCRIKSKSLKSVDNTINVHKNII